MLLSTEKADIDRGEILGGLAPPPIHRRESFFFTDEKVVSEKSWKQLQHNPSLKKVAPPPERDAQGRKVESGSGGGGGGGAAKPKARGPPPMSMADELSKALKKR